MIQHLVGQGVAFKLVDFYLDDNHMALQPSTGAILKRSVAVESKLDESLDSAFTGEFVTLRNMLFTESDLFLPVRGEVVEVNREAVDSPELVNQEPYGRGWLVKVRLRDAGELDALLSPEAYDELIVREMQEETD